MKNPHRYHILHSPRIRVTVLTLCVMLIIFTTLELSFHPEIRAAYPTIDYEAFYVAGRIFWEGHLADAYNSTALFEAQREIVVANSYKKWTYTYPPHFNFITAALALVPVWLGYAAFMLSTFFAYVIVLRRLSGDQYIFVLLVLFPSIIVCTRTGQTGFLLGGLLGAFALMILKRHPLAGFPLAVATIKPHYLLGIGLYLLLRRDWKTIVTGAAATAVMLSVATAVFGIGIWAPFVFAVRESSEVLQLGLYPLERMTSIYAALHTLGAPPEVAMAGQGFLGLVVMGGLFHFLRHGWPSRHLLGLGIMGTIFLSPYSYDYDLPILGIALALFTQDIIRRSTTRQIILIFLLAWVAGGYGLMTTLPDPIMLPALSDNSPSLSAWALIPLCLLVLRVVRQPIGDAALSLNNPTMQ